MKKALLAAQGKSDLQLQDHLQEATLPSLSTQYLRSPNAQLPLRVNSIMFSCVAPKALENCAPI